MNNTIDKVYLDRNSFFFVLRKSQRDDGFSEQDQTKKNAKFSLSFFFDETDGHVSIYRSLF